MESLHIVVDLQYGSCGKGLFSGYLAEVLHPDTIITAWSPNSGHTYITRSGEKMVNTAIPNGIVSPNLKRVLIGPGSVINPGQMMCEIERYAKYLDGVDILIHENAAVVTQEHIEAERCYAFSIGSTMKGVGEAVIQKIRRTGNPTARQCLMNTPLEQFLVSTSNYNAAVDAADLAVIEGSQGFSLGINNGFYPYTTSRECTVHQLLSDCSIPRRAADIVRVHGVARTFPIRVANRYDEEGNRIGWSGPVYDDQVEIDWKDLGIEPELTTVTKLPRRVFTWSHNQIVDAVRMNGINDIFLNFTNYINLDHTSYPRPLEHYLGSCLAAGAPVRWLGTGPTYHDVRARGA